MADTTPASDKSISSLEVPDTVQNVINNATDTAAYIASNAPSYISNALSYIQQSIEWNKTSLSSDYISTILNVSFNSGSSGESTFAEAEDQTEINTLSKDIINILDSYSWRANNGNNLAANISGSIPRLYAVERRQRIGSSVSNMLNLIGGTNDITTNMNYIAGLISNNTANDIATTGINTIQGALSGVNYLVASTLVNDKSFHDNHLSNILSPYSQLYYTADTGKRFIIPYLKQESVFSSINSYDSQSNNILNEITSSVKGLIEGWGGVALDVANMIRGSKNETSYEGRTLRGLAIETAKTYNFNSDGDELSVMFPLFNTLKKDEWQRNFKFIYLFLLRNMPIKTSATTYIPPVMYDVLIPGLKRIPLGYVSNFSASPIGISRNMNINNSFIPTIGNLNKSTIIPTPEAWVINITFKGLLSKTANTLLSSTVDLPFSVSST